MDINEIKKLIKNSKAVLVMDNSEPSFVILDYEAYKNMIADKADEKEVKINHPNGPKVFNGRGYQEKETEILDRLNKDILALKSQIEAEEKELSTSPEQDTTERRAREY